MTDFEQIWQQKYTDVPQQLKKVQQVDTVVTAFNTNIDAVIKISGRKISELAQKMHISLSMAESNHCRIDTPHDVLCGLIKCFTGGNAEEWLVYRSSVYDWLKQNIGYDHLQMGGQGGIVANAMAVLGVKKVVVHTASHPRLQADQFLNLPNLFAVNEEATLQPAHQIERADDLPLIHWIIEFAKDDEIHIDGQTYTCPKANRFIATYDPANTSLLINRDFVRYIDENGYDYLILSGFHGLSSDKNGIERLKDAARIITKWKNLYPQSIIHLELASTQDKTIRRHIIENIAPLVDSLGLNDREALEILEIINPTQYNQINHKKLTSPQLFEICRQIRQTTQTPRLQLHMYGLYFTLQPKNFIKSPLQNLRGMILAATVAASKAGLGKLAATEDLLWAHQNPQTEISFNELLNLGNHLHAPQLLTDGIFEYEDLNIIAVPTLLIAQPLTLVGMGDTISSVSLIGAE